MATFIVRVQLTNENSSNYALLRGKLLAIGFTKRIKSKDGVEYRLPNGCYRIVSDNDLNTILNEVEGVAHTVDKTPMILVTESKDKGNSWSGLQKC